MQRRRGDDRGATVLEFALVAPLLLLLLLGIIDAGSAYSGVLRQRAGTEQAARRAAVADLGPAGTCPLFPAPANAATRDLMCLTKTLTGLPAAEVRVRVALGARGFVEGDPVVVCTEWRPTSVSGALQPFLAGAVVRHRSVHRIEWTGPPAAPLVLVSASESPIGGTWGWCQS